MWDGPCTIRGLVNISTGSSIVHDTNYLNSTGVLGSEDHKYAKTLGEGTTHPGH